MSDVKFTNEQQLAIDTRNSDILVAAAAGSGKTAVLVERIIKMILDEKNPVDIDELLVVTFTEAAASEMKQRISAAISKELEKNSDNEHLQKQITYLDKAFITTIHSFCLRIIRQNFNLIDIDPTFRIADTTEITLIKKEVIDEIFEAEYERENNEDFLTLVEWYGDKVRDLRLQSLILTLYEFVNNSPNPEEFINSSCEKFNIGDKSIDNTDWGKIIINDIKSILNGASESLEKGIEISKMPNGPYKYIDNFIEDRVIINDLLSWLDVSLDRFYEEIDNVEFSRLKSLRNEDVWDDLKDRAQKIRNKEIKDEVKNIKKTFFFKPIEEMREDILKLYPVMKSLGELVLKFKIRFQEMKKEKNIVDFNDLEHFCLEILIDENEINEKKRSKKAIEISQKFKEVLIDEYQDSNLIQELILWAVSTDNPKNRFMVGDVKQSIYKFRRARPELFIEKYNSFGKVFNGENLKIDLHQNFRSRKEVLSSINFLFFQLMTEEVGEIDYNDDQALYVSAKFPDNPENFNISTNTEIHLIDQAIPEESDFHDDDGVEELNKLQLEAKVIGERIKELIYVEKLHIKDGETLRPVRFGDIVILARSVSFAGEVFIRELKKMDIPVFANTAEGFWSSIEILTITSILKIIDNPIQDIEILSVLYSPIYFVDSNELLEIRNAQPEKSFYEALKVYMGEDYSKNLETSKKLEKFLNDLSEWRDVATHMPISDLILKIYNDTNYFDYVGGMAGGLIRQANLRRFREKAVKYEDTGYKSLFHFVKFIERLENSETDEGGAKVSSENENVVKMMTIHKSKGLEFPVVFVSMLGKQFNLTEMRENLLLHKDLGLGPTIIDLEFRTKSNTLPKLAISRKILRENLSEELRVLYVALTRAKEKLILTGVEKNLTKKMENWGRFIDLESETLPVHYMMKGRSFLDYILPAAARHKTGAVLNCDSLHYKNKEVYEFDTNFSIKIWKHEDILSNIVSTQIENFLKLEELEKINIEENYSGCKEEIFENLNFVYPNEYAKTLPSKITISEMKRKFYEDEMTQTNSTELSEHLEISEHEFNMIFKKPEFLREEKGLTSAERGIAIHKVVEHLDFKYHNTYDRVVELLKQLYINFLTPQEVKIIPINKIVRFVNSDLGKRLAKSEKIKKEEPFIIGLTPYETFGDEKYLGMENKILLHGIIDCFFEENDKIVLLDYKSDYVDSENLESVKDRYRIQMNIYKKAIETFSGKKVEEAYIYFFGLGDYVKM